MSLRLPRWFFFASALAVSPVAIAGCSLQAGEGDQSSGAITEVKQSSVKDQSIGNCWTYAATGWVESLVKTANDKEMNLSESYVTYWYWYSQIAVGGLSAPAITEGGTFGAAAELMRHYGMMNEGDFIASEATAVLSKRQETALAAMNASLSTGALKTTAARADGKLVRQELDKAWALDPAVVANLDSTFGADGAKTLIDVTVPDGVPILAMKDLPAKLLNPTTKAVEDASVADAIGTPEYDWNPEARTGPLAWNSASYPGAAETTGRRDFLKRVQRALHDSQPVIISWYVDFNALNAQGQFLAPPATPGQQGGHMTILEDYEITDVPGFGTLPAGVLETRPEALQAALDDKANITFLRIKNSWGTYRSPTGYHDLYMTYMNGPIQICDTDKDEKPILASCHDGVPFEEVVLPAGY